MFFNKQKKMEKKEETRKKIEKLESTNMVLAVRVEENQLPRHKDKNKTKTHNENN